jgi:hypothetical protein
MLECELRLLRGQVKRFLLFKGLQRGIRKLIALTGKLGGIGEQATTPVPILTGDVTFEFLLLRPVVHR